MEELKSYISKFELGLEECNFVRIDSNDPKLLSIIKTFRKITELITTSLKCFPLDSTQWPPVIRLTNLLGKTLSTDKSENFMNLVELMTHLMRFLRNAAASEENLCVLKDETIMRFAKIILKIFLEKKSEEEVLLLLMSIQFFGNICVSDEVFQPEVWDLFYSESYFSSLLSHENERIKNAVMMVFYFSIPKANCESLVHEKGFQSVLVSFFDSFLILGQSNMWGQKLLDSFLQKPELFPFLYEILTTEQKLFVLDQIDHMLFAPEENEDENLISKETLLYFRNHFINLIEKILKPKVNLIEKSEIFKLLNILCTASTSSSFMADLQDSKDLLKTSINGLKHIHFLYKEEMCKNSQQKSLKTYDSLFSCKVGLVQLIGNLSYRCKVNQDIVRNLDGIPLILDCSSIDQYNPYIGEWCVLAIRNLLENNLENQAVVVGITGRGEVAPHSSNFLSELGLQAQFEDGVIRVRNAR